MTRIETRVSYIPSTGVCSSTNHHADVHRDKRPPDRFRHISTIDDRIHIRHHHFLYAVIAVLVTCIIDYKLLALPLVALAAYAIIGTVFTLPIEVEKILDLSIFRIDWTSKVEVRCEEVTKVVVVEKPLHHYYYNTETGPASSDAATQTLPDRKPKYVDQASSTTATKYTSSGVQTETPAIVKPKYTDQATSTEIALTKTAGTQTSSGIYTTTTPQQDAEMRRSEAMRNRLRRPGIDPSQREVTPVEDIIVVEIDRTAVPILSIKRFKCLLSLQLEANPIFPQMPASAPCSSAMYANHDPWYYTREQILSDDGSRVMVDNYYNWTETSIKHVFVSTSHLGKWLVRTQDQAYVFQWTLPNNIWYCAEHGFGFYENEPGDEEPFCIVYGNLNTADPNMMGPIRTGHALQGPYYDDVVKEVNAFIEKQNKEVRLQKAAEKRAKEEESRKAREMQEAQWRAEQEELLRAQQEQQAQWRAEQEEVRKAHELREAQWRAEQARSKARREEEEKKKKASRTAEEIEKDVNEQKEKMKQSRENARRHRARQQARNNVAGRR